MPSRRRSTDRPAPRLRLSIQLGDRVESAPVARSQLRRWVAAAVERDCAFTLRLVDAREGRTLNRLYRGRDYATNVLTFEYGEDGGSDGAVQADIVICLPVATREARAQRKLPHDHLAHLVVHGVLHAQGWDHERGDQEAADMEARERAILARFRIADPYAET